MPLDNTTVVAPWASNSVDRLERAGYVRREPDPADRRRVIVAPMPQQMAKIAPMYTGMAHAWAAAMTGYDDEQLTLILTLFDQLHEITQAEIARLQHAQTHDSTPR